MSKSLFESMIHSFFSRPKREVVKNKIYYVHFRNYHPYMLDEISCKGGATVALRVMADNSVVAATSVCSLADNFCRKTGRDIATARLARENYGADARNTHSFTANEIAHTLTLSELSAVEDLAWKVLDNTSQLPILVENNKSTVVYDFRP